METMYSVTQLARALHVCELTVSRWIKAGKLEYVELSPRRRLIPESSVKNFLDSKIIRPPQKMVDRGHSPGKDAKSRSLKNEDTGEMNVKSLRKEISQLCRSN